MFNHMLYKVRKPTTFLTHHEKCIVYYRLLIFVVIEKYVNKLSEICWGCTSISLSPFTCWESLSRLARGASSAGSAGGSRVRAQCLAHRGPSLFLARKWMPQGWDNMTKKYEFNWRIPVPDILQQGCVFDRWTEVCPDSRYSSALNNTRWFVWPGKRFLRLRAAMYV